MAGIFSVIKSLLSYKEPQNVNSNFELLESGDDKKNPGKSQEEHIDINCPKANNKEDKHAKGIKFPLKVEEWNEHKKAPETCPPTVNLNVVSCDLCVNIELLKKRFNLPKNQAIILREFKIAKKVRALIVFMDEMIDKKIVNRDILPNLMSKDSFDELGEENLLTYIIESVLSVSSVTKDKTFDTIIHQIIAGSTALFVDGYDECLLIQTKGYEKRAIDKPLTETVIKGAQEGFTENLKTNLSLLRRIIRSENLVSEIVQVGNVNKINCAVMYMDSIVNPDLVMEVKRRLSAINTDYILGDGMVEQFLEDNSYTLFPQTLSTERPDRTSSFLMDGQVVIITDGTPFALAVPVTFYQLLQTSEDSFLRWPYGSFLRLIRVLGTLIAAFLPGLYVALILYHQEMIPTELLSTIARSKEEVPFPTVIEILMMEFAFELIREGGIRIPGVIGQTLGIVGALILGQAAVAAGLVSPILIIIVSVTGLGSFVIPNYSLSLGIRIIRFIYIIFGALAGFYGISAAIVLTGGIMCSIKSFGVPFFSPVAPKTKLNPDLILRAPVWMQKIRPDYLNTQTRKKSDNTKER